MTKTFTVTTEISYDDLWEAVWGSAGSGMVYWSSMIRQPDRKDIDLFKDGKPNPQNFIVYEDEADVWHLVTLDSLADAYRWALTTHQTHCGHYSVTDFEEADACVGDILIQYAIFGEIVYG